MSSTYELMADSHNMMSAVSLTYNDIVSLFHLRQIEAAEFLGISLTSLKKACRRVGVSKWPYSRTRPRFVIRKREPSNEPLQAEKVQPKEQACSVQPQIESQPSSTASQSEQINILDFSSNLFEELNDNQPIEPESEINPFSGLDLEWVDWYVHDPFLEKGE
ncbi:hypothetical protein GUITHDRAFT_104957 [Guillardia theta CCMP2712]|uniref:RWP-RK domain-containing protein n=1 Tax=Guillardia theta (strain CCMP2712) TaxID=905079 RepID=L1JMX5_GUITC|nr:hypothetical protein GUITHDRAFT_104957 [Guillardia theta CCMP2712]EKX49428.1 hypothetical protein GUITHDRAFT_104957 [Guillardia theta CCMP2712]|eukprot:XP_005836408.1 hypothetical protein GUITHDRAFT_104957 [Guillardia theta CCMP2712]